MIWRTITLVAAALAAGCGDGAGPGLTPRTSYPYLGGFGDPESIPLDYYSRIEQGGVAGVGRRRRLAVGLGWRCDVLTRGSGALHHAAGTAAG